MRFYRSAIETYSNLFKHQNTVQGVLGGIYEGVQNMGTLEIRRGDIFYIEKHGWQCGSEQFSGRPGVVVSNDVNNRRSGTVEIVYCTTKPKEDMPTHVQILNTRSPSTVLCEQITTVSIERLGDYIGRCNEREMFEIDLALAESIGICPGHPHFEPKREPEDEKEEDQQPQEPQSSCENAEMIVKLRTECETYRVMYEKLMDKIILARVDLADLRVDNS